MSYMGRGHTSVGNPSIPLILLTGSAYFVEKLNIKCESCILIGWLNKSDNRIGKRSKVHVQDRTFKSRGLHQKLHPVLSF